MKNKYIMLILAFCCHSLAFSAQIQTVQYWFNTAFAGRVTQSVTPDGTVQLSEINTTGLNDGLHLLHIRAKDNTNWSVVHSQLFYKLSFNGQSVVMSKFEYWVDADFAGKRQGTLSGQSATVNELNFASLAEGLHVLHIRAIDNLGRYTPVHSQLFYKLNETSGNNEIVACEYWADDNFTGRISTSASGQIVTINNLFGDATLTTGIHTVSFRAKDAAGRWSTVHTSGFYKNEVIPDGINKIAAYHYWYDNDYEGRQSVTLNSPVTPYELKQKYELPTGLNEGKHAFHVQFCDLSGKWSVATTDTFKVVPLFSESEFAALKAFYGATNGSEWYNTQVGEAVWDTLHLATVNDWKGVRITGGRVSGLELTGNNLTGNIPASVFKELPHLTVLRVDSNSVNLIEALPKAISLNIKAQNFNKGDVLLDKEVNLIIPVDSISRYVHSSGVFTENNSFDLNINGIYTTRVTSSSGNASIAKSYISALNKGDELTLVQYNGDAIGTVYRYLAKDKDDNAISPVSTDDPVISSQYFDLLGKEAKYLQRGSIYMVKEVHQSRKVSVKKIVVN